MKFKKALAGLIAAAAALNLSVPITAFEDEPENAPVQIDDVVIYDPVTHTYSYENGAPYVPMDHNPGIWDDIVTDVELPAKYDTRELFEDKQLPFPEIKDQNPTGSCWAHATMAAAEINGILKGVVDPNNCNFSEAHLNYFAIVGDPDPESDLYGDTVYKFKGVSSFNDYYSIYNNGGNMPLASSVLSRGTGPVIEPPEWDIGYATDNTFIIIDNSGNYPVIFDTVSRSQLYIKNGYNAYMKDGVEIVLNGVPYSLQNNIKNNLYFTSIDEQYRYDSEYTLVSAESYSYDYDASDINSIRNIKEAVMEKGCLTLGYYADTRDSMVSSQYGYYLPLKALIASVDGITEDTPKSQLPSNHSISIIGWDDDYAVENFYSGQSNYSFSKWVNENGSWKQKTTTFTADELRPQKKGAWLCRNSWGSSYGDGGYFYISYEEPELREIYSYDLGSDQLYGEKIYQNFGAASNRYLIFKDGYTAANIFNAEADDTITAISFFTGDFNCQYSYKIYTGVTSGYPISGTPAASGSGTFKNGGYHTVDLQTPVSVTKGENFSIVLSTNDTICNMDTYNKGEGNSFIASRQNANLSYYFNDTYNIYNTYSFNVWLKALTAGSSDIKPAAPAGLTATPGNGSVSLKWDAADGAAYYNIYYSESKDSNFNLHSTVKANSFTVSNLNNGTTYYFKVTSCNENGEESAYSETVSATPKYVPTITITNQPSDVTVIGGTKFSLTASAAYTSGISMDWQYNDGSGWQKLSSALRIKSSGGVMTSTATVSDSAKYKGCTFRCAATDNKGNTVFTDTVTLSFYSEAQVTAGMVEALDSTDITNYVNYFTSLYNDNFVLTPAQLRAVELVLAKDYDNAA